MLAFIRRSFLTLVVTSPLVAVALADSAWWEICSTCESENDFRVAAIGSGAEDEFVFVSNPESLETKKFDKFSTLEDFGTGMVRMTHVMAAEFPQHERDAFRDALQKSQTVFATIESDMVNVLAGVPDYPSALFEIRNGRLGNSFFFGLHAAINIRGLLPTRESVGASAGVNIRGLGGGNFGANDTVRVVPLALRVRYPDGSHINAIYNPDGSWSEVSVVDTEGNSIDIDVDESLNPVVIASLIGDYAFSGENVQVAITDFIQAVSGAPTTGGVLSCEWEEHEGGGRLVCKRQ